MRKIIDVAFVFKGIKYIETFHPDVLDWINKYQSKGLEVDIQFRQSDYSVSALITAYKEE